MALLTLSDPRLPPLLRGPVLVDDRLRPRFWPAVDAYLLHGGLKPATAKIRLRAIERLYRFADQIWLGDTLDAVIGRQDLARLDDLLHAYFSKLRREAQQTDHPADEAWRIACQFATGICERLLVSGPPRRFAAARQLLDRLGRLDHQLALRSRRARRGQPRGLPAIVLEDLYELALPDSPRNPFRSAALRWRNFVLFLLLLHQGLRRSEVLVLPVDSVKSEFDQRTGKDRFWLYVSENPNEPDDPRPDRPSLKNGLATRPIPISRPLVDAIETFVENYRGRRDRSYLLYSQKNNPLSKREINDVFRVLSRNLSKAAQRDLWNRRRPVRVTPHDLRHTCAAVRLNQLVGDDHGRLPMAIEQLRPFFGWSRDSEMPKLYARTYFEAQIAKVWRDDFDARVEFLRSVP